jgi:hypothetical protein
MVSTGAAPAASAVFAKASCNTRAGPQVAPLSVRRKVMMSAGPSSTLVPIVLG